MSKTGGEKRQANGTLVENLAETLREAIVAGEYKVGDKLPSEAQLTLNHGVSRTVVREAVTILRADGLVEPRQGAGVFIIDPVKSAVQPFQDIDYKKISTVLELLELRAAVEVEAAGLAAQRRSPAQEEDMVLCLQQIDQCAAAGQSTADADFALHISIAAATNNHRFREFLEMIGRDIIPRAALGVDKAELKSNVERLQKEHAQIIDAVLDGDVERARDAMRVHLLGGRQRYRMILRKAEKFV
ncbi:FadR family transcriptional regulator [Aureimonas fodinaquatilis]|uniref:FadR family transcriptional regulator n=1 Tax=Aureimonas fodinaquatilis TaxID=2565783 RepID=A0A5B0DST3_9HYPH|nr:FadR/GntR family transcriptional regulator [Aureimonas fodinaquatilis]KAA0969453.1 FadR family transcriptional regulator [Aureimonas fodinaquatilis]